MSKDEKTVDANDCAKMLKAMADGERLRIVCALQNGAKSVGDIAIAVDLPLVNTSHHLQVLLHAGLVASEKRGRNVFYRLAHDVFPNRPGELDLGCCQLTLEPKRIT